MDATLERIIAKMTEEHIKDQEMIEYLGLPRGAFSNWRREKGKSYYYYIAKIADRLGVTIDFLIRGNEIEMNTLRENEKILIEYYRKLSKEGQKTISANVRLLADKNA